MMAKLESQKQKQPNDPVQAFNQRYIEDLKRMKQEQENLRDGRRRWFNREIDKIKGELE